jgi:hypothetical protein
MVVTCQTHGSWQEGFEIMDELPNRWCEKDHIHAITVT